MSAEDRFRDSSGKRECFISMVVSLLDVTTATQQFTVSGYVNAIWQVIPDFEQQEATNKIYPTKKMQEEGMLSVKQQLEDNGKKDDDKKFCEYILESVAPGGTRYYVTDFVLTCAPCPVPRDHRLLLTPELLGAQAGVVRVAVQPGEDVRGQADRGVRGGGDQLLLLSEGARQRGPGAPANSHSRVRPLLLLWISAVRRIGRARSRWPPSSRQR